MTDLLYLQDTNLTECECHVAAQTTVDGKTALVLNQSPFYPKGGGQPADIGVIIGASGRFRVEDVRKDPGNDEVLHIGRFEHGEIIVGESAKARIDRAVRFRNARLHTSGEVIAAVVHRMGKRWPITAASHIPGQARVAFKADITQDELPAFINEFEAQFRAIRDEDHPVIARLDVSEEEAVELCPLDVEALREKSSGIRLISPATGFCRPCLGAHLNRTSEIGEIEFRKIRLKKGELSISYDLA